MSTKLNHLLERKRKRRNMKVQRVMSLINIIYDPILVLNRTLYRFCDESLLHTYEDSAQTTNSTGTEQSIPGFQIPASAELRM